MSIKDIFKRRPVLPPPSCRHDLRSENQDWGHALTINKTYGDEKTGNLADCSGHITPHAKIGDQVILSMDSGRDAVWVFTKVKNTNDPSDMFFATIRIVDYLENVEEVKSAKTMFL